MSQLLGIGEGITMMTVAFFLALIINDWVEPSPKTMALVLIVINGIALLAGIVIQLYVCWKYWWN